MNANKKEEILTMYSPKDIKAASWQLEPDRAAIMEKLRQGAEPSQAGVTVVKVFTDEIEAQDKIISDLQELMKLRNERQSLILGIDSALDCYPSKDFGSTVTIKYDSDCSEDVAWSFSPEKTPKPKEEN